MKNVDGDRYGTATVRKRTLPVSIRVAVFQRSVHTRSFRECRQIQQNLGVEDMVHLLHEKTRLAYSRPTRRAEILVEIQLLPASHLSKTVGDVRQIGLGVDWKRGFPIDDPDPLPVVQNIIDVQVVVARHSIWVVAPGVE